MWARVSLSLPHRENDVRPCRAKRSDLQQYRRRASQAWNLYAIRAYACQKLAAPAKTVEPWRRAQLAVYPGGEVSISRTLPPGDVGRQCLCYPEEELWPRLSC
jgi:hypothetical protein